MEIGQPFRKHNGLTSNGWYFTNAVQAFNHRYAHLKAGDDDKLAHFANDDRLGPHISGRLRHMPLVLANSLPYTTGGAEV